MRTACGFPTMELAVGESGKVVSKLTCDFQPTRTVIVVTAPTRVLVRSILVAGKEALPAAGEEHEAFSPQSTRTLRYPAAKAGDEIVIDAINHGNEPCVVVTTILGEVDGLAPEAAI